MTDSLIKQGNFWGARQSRSAAVSLSATIISVSRLMVYISSILPAISYLISTRANLNLVYIKRNKLTMSMQRGQKLNQLQHLLSEGLVVSSSWLEDHEYSNALRSKYVSNGWLKQPARGIYARPGANTKWQHLIISMQSLMRMPVAVGGLSALELQGFGHYIRVGSTPSIYLYTERRLAKWLD